ncbi:gram-positive signal peptide protein, YSIRK family [delta proteobacterium NaphS2]|nr:gram-positive signal peptide protein, YSIRK family [delta proteobacterium NaphS2]
MNDETVRKSKQDRSPACNYHQFVPILILILCLSTILMGTLRITGHGFEPYDDALRHVAKVVSGKAWSEILVVRPEITMDSHPGWHAILKGFKILASGEPDDLLVFSVASLFLLFAFIPVFLFRRPEAWILALLVMLVFSFPPLFRTFFGRPYIFSMFVVVLFCFLWKPIRDRHRTYLALAGYALITSLATWIHGAWYLLGLPLGALLLAREWRVLWLMSCSTGVGVVLGSFFTGSPLTFLHQMVFHAIVAFGTNDFSRQLVGEFQPFDGVPFVLILVTGILLWKRSRGEWDIKCVDNPVFFLGAMGWGMGFVAWRFWTDWGWPAITVWVALELELILEKELEQFSLKRLGIVAVACAVFFIAITNDRNSRWTGKLGTPWPLMAKAEHRPWLPNEGGILYSNNMDVFYHVFFHNPHGPWRYILGFEPAWMPKKDLAVYRQIQLSRKKAENYKPWVDKMTEKDRMMLISASQPKIPGLTWHEVVPTVWSGRLPLREKQGNTHNQ